jgi:hypothetical protein
MKPWFYLLFTSLAVGACANPPHTPVASAETLPTPPPATNWKASASKTAPSISVTPTVDASNSASAWREGPPNKTATWMSGKSRTTNAPNAKP